MKNNEFFMKNRRENYEFHHFVTVKNIGKCVKNGILTILRVYGPPKLTPRTPSRTPPGPVRDPKTGPRTPKTDFRGLKIKVS